MAEYVQIALILCNAYSFSCAQPRTSFCGSQSHTGTFSGVYM